MAAVVCAAALFMSCEKEPEPQEIPDNIFFTTLPGTVLAVSPNAELVVFRGRGNDIFMANTTTDETTELFFGMPVEISAVSNNGIVVGSCVVAEGERDGFYYYAHTGVMETPDTPAGFGPECVITGISADGSVMAGYAMHQADGMYKGVKWTNDKPEALPYPTDDRFGDNNVEPKGIYPESVSPDGRIIAGRVDVGTTSQGVFWRNGEWKWMGGVNEQTVELTDGGETIDVKFTAKHGGQFSANSRYCCASFGIWGKSVVGVNSEIEAPAIFDFQTETMAVVSDKGQGFAHFASNSGELSYRNLDFTAPKAYFRWPTAFGGGSGGSGGLNSTGGSNGVETEGQPYVQGLFDGIYIGPCVTILQMTEDRSLVVGTFFNSDNGLYIPFYIRRAS